MLRDKRMAGLASVEFGLVASLGRWPRMGRTESAARMLAAEKGLA
jgi:hypothetical protein